MNAIQTLNSRLKKSKNKKRTLLGAYKQLATSRRGRESGGEFRDLLKTDPFEGHNFANYVAEKLSQYGLTNHANRLREQYPLDISLLEDIVNVSGRLYAKTPESLEELKAYLTIHGYDIKDCSESFSDKPSREVQEKKGYALWNAHLSEKRLQNKAKCGSCNSLINISGVRMHNHKCEVCGDNTYVAFTKKGTVTFSIMENPAFLEDLTLIVHSYDEKNKRLNFFLNPDDSGLDDWNKQVGISYAKLEDMRERFPDTFKEIEINGVKVLSTHNDTTKMWLDRRIDKINIAETRGSKQNYKIVKAFDGKEFGKWGKLPVPEGFSIYEAWHWAPLEPSQKLHEKIISAGGKVSDCGYYYQDGRTEFRDVHLERMRVFVEHLTTLGINEWDEMIEYAPKSGPGMVKAIAEFCHPHAQVDNYPNIGNAMVAMGKVMHGERITEQELVAAEAGIISDDQGVLESVVTHLVEEANTVKPRVLSKKEKSKLQDDLDSLK